MNHDEYCAQFLGQGGLLLDVGAGHGQFLCDMAKRGFRAFGVEKNAEYIREAGVRATEQKVIISLVKAGAEDLPFKSDYFDFVNCAEVTEHVDDSNLVAREIFRVLKPGGKCYISFHNRFSWYDYHYHLYFINWLPRALAEPILRMLGKQKQDSPAIGRQKLATMHYYTHSRISRILKEIGFEVVDIRVNKIKNSLGLSSLPVLVLYVLFLRPLYFNTFHLLLTKKWNILACGISKKIDRTGLCPSTDYCAWSSFVIFGFRPARRFSIGQPAVVSGN